MEIVFKFQAHSKQGETNIPSAGLAVNLLSWTVGKEWN